MALRFTESASVGVKAVMIGAIVLLLLIPLMMLRGLVSERSILREQAYSRVAEGWGGDIVAGGPLLIIPTQRVVTDDENKTRIVRSDIYLLPSQLDIDVSLQLEPEPRYVGIYAVPVYLSHVHLSGQFDFAALQPLLGQPDVTYLWEQSRLRLPLSHVRSLREVQQARLADRDIKLGPAGPGLYRGVESGIDIAELMKTPAARFEFKAVLASNC